MARTYKAPLKQFIKELEFEGLTLIERTRLPHEDGGNILKYYFKNSVHSVISSLHARRWGCIRNNNNKEHEYCFDRRSYCIFLDGTDDESVVTVYA